MIRRGLALIVMCGFAGPVLPDTMQDCMQMQDDKLRLSACTEIIDAGAVGKQRAIAHLLRGAARASDNDHSGAVADFSETIALKPGMPMAGDAHYSRARSHAAMGNADAASADFNSAVDLAPKHAIYLNFRGEFLLDQGEVRAALADFEATMQANITFFRAWVNRGRALAKLGEVGSAVYYWENVMQTEGPRRVRWFQEHLTEKGHYAGPVDGEFSEAVLEATKACARDRACLW